MVMSVFGGGKEGGQVVRRRGGEEVKRSMRADWDSGVEWRLASRRRIEESVPF